MGLEGWIVVGLLIATLWFSLLMGSALKIAQGNARTHMKAHPEWNSWNPWNGGRKRTSGDLAVEPLTRPNRPDPQPGGGHPTKEEPPS